MAFCWMKSTLQDYPLDFTGLVLPTGLCKRERGGDWAVQHPPTITTRQTRLFFWDPFEKAAPLSLQKMHPNHFCEQRLPEVPEVADFQQQ